MTRSESTDRDLHPYMTVPEVAADLRVSPATVYRLVNSGALPGKRFSSVLRVARTAVADYVERSGAGDPA